MKPEGQENEKEKQKEKPPAPVKVDFEKISQRILSMPVPARNYSELDPRQGRCPFSCRRPAGRAIKRSERSHRASLRLENAKNRSVAGKHSRLPRLREWREASSTAKPEDRSLRETRRLHRFGSSHQFRLRLAPGASSAGTAAQIAGAKTLNLSAMEVRVEPAAEWKEMYHEAFRLERDFFYDPGFHGLDLAAAEKKYAAYLPGRRLARRPELHLRRSYGRTHRRTSLRPRR